MRAAIPILLAGLVGAAEPATSSAALADGVARVGAAYRHLHRLRGSYLAEAAPAGAPALHVDAVHGDDAGDGSPARPFRTIGRALALVAPGARVVLHAGVYREMALAAVGGTAAAPITLEGAPGERAVISGADPVAGWRPLGDGRWCRDGWEVDSQQVFQDGVPLLQIGPGCMTDDREPDTALGAPPLWRNYLPAVGSGPGDLVPGSFRYQADERRLYLRPAAGADPNRVAIEAAVRESAVRPAHPGIGHWRLRNLVCERNSYGTRHRRYGGAGLVTVRGRGWVVDGCTLRQADISGLHLNGGDHLVLGCNLVANGCQGFTLNGMPLPGSDGEPGGILIRDCLVAGNNQRGFGYFHEAGGNKLAISARTVIERCALVHNRGPGIWYDIDNADFLIARCLVGWNVQGIHIEISRGAGLVLGNVVVGHHHQGVYISGSGGNAVAGNAILANRWGLVVHGMPRHRADLARTYLDGHPGYDRAAEAARLADGARTLMPLYDNCATGNLIAGNQVTETVLYTGRGSHGNRLWNNWYQPGGAGLALSAAGYKPNCPALAAAQAFGQEQGSLEAATGLAWGGGLPSLPADGALRSWDPADPLLAALRDEDGRPLCRGPWLEPGWGLDPALAGGTVPARSAFTFAPRPQMGKDGSLLPVQDDFAPAPR
jgi:hypothetical protein